MDHGQTSAAELVSTSHGKALLPGSIAKYFAGNDCAFSGSSNYLDMCELAVKISHASVECRACDGMGFRAMSAATLQSWSRKLAEVSEDASPEHREEKRDQIRKTMSRESECLVCCGSGYTTQRRIDMAAAMHPMFTTVRCGKCRGCGETFPPTDATAEVQDVCPGCHGVTYVVPVTVKEKGSTKTGKPPKREPGGSDDDELGSSSAFSAWVDEDAVVERGRVGREIDAIRRSDPVVGAGIESYYGLDGDKWGPHKWGRTFALWQHTQAGQRLADEGAIHSRASHGFLMKPLDLIASECDIASRSGAEGRTTREGRHRAALIAQADKQARELLGRIRAAIRGAEEAA